MTPRPLAPGDRVIVLEGSLPEGFIAAIVHDRCIIQAAGRRLVRFCDQVVRLQPATPADRSQKR